MSVRKAFVYEEILRRRKRIGWLGWLAIMITATFLVALGVLAWRAMSQQPTRLTTTQPTEVAVANADPNTTTLPAVPIAATLPSVSEPVDHPQSWTVFKNHDPLGQEMWDASPEVKTWVVQDYLNALAWTDAHMFEPEYQAAHLDEFYAGKRLAEMREVIEWQGRTKKVIAVSQVERLPIGVRVSSFSQDGRTVIVHDYHAAGVGKVFNLKTRQESSGAPYPNTLHMIEMQYDAAAQRWKIAREPMNYDLTANKIIWQEEWDRAQ